MDAFRQVYDLLGIRFDHIYYESEVEDSGKEIVDELINKGIAKDERPEGAVIVDLDEILGTKEKYRVLVVLRSDGTSLYSTKGPFSGDQEIRAISPGPLHLRDRCAPIAIHVADLQGHGIDGVCVGRELLSPGLRNRQPARQRNHRFTRGHCGSVGGPDLGSGKTRPGHCSGKESGPAGGGPKRKLPAPLPSAPSNIP